MGSETFLYYILKRHYVAIPSVRQAQNRKSLTLTTTPIVVLTDLRCRGRFQAYPIELLAEFDEEVTKQFPLQNTSWHLSGHREWVLRDFMSGLWNKDLNDAES
jgi:hypothetical protein